MPTNFEKKLQPKSDFINSILNLAFIISSKKYREFVPMQKSKEMKIQSAKICDKIKEVTKSWEDFLSEVEDYHQTAFSLLQMSELRTSQEKENTRKFTESKYPPKLDSGEINKDFVSNIIKNSHIPFQESLDFYYQTISEIIAEIELFTFCNVISLSKFETIEQIIKEFEENVSQAKKVLRQKISDNAESVGQDKVVEGLKQAKFFFGKSVVKLHKEISSELTNIDI